MSKKVPLLLVTEVKDSERTEQDQVQKVKLLFKYGDDLRQDNLVLQFFRIMDEMWMEKDRNMEIVRYKVLETGNEVGYIEFVDNSDVIASMHKWRGFWKGTFDERSIYEWFKQECYPEIFKLNYEDIADQRAKKPNTLDESHVQ